MPFTDRTDAGRRLAARLGPLLGPDAVVLGLPRGGVPVAFEVARALGAPLDVIVVRKLGVPFQPELAMGAVGEGDVRVLDEEVLRRTQVDEAELADVERRERAAVDRRVERFRAGHPRIPLAGRTAVVVDDGIATGSTARVACRVARAAGASRVVLAVPVAPAGTPERMRSDADEVICLETPRWFDAVGRFYDDFRQVDDDEVRRLLRRARSTEPVPASAALPPDDPAADPPLDEEVVVPVDGERLAARLAAPEHPRGVVIFAHGSGSSRHSPRNRLVAAHLNAAGYATVLLDLLTVEEETARVAVFDVDLLAHRLLAVTAVLRRRPELRSLPVGFFGASTGAAAALWAAAEPEAHIGAIVSRGGRPDLAGFRLGRVTAPTLLIVGGDDDVVVELNRQAELRLAGEHRMRIVPGATHLFEEPGALEQVARLAVQWFVDHLTRVGSPVG